MCLVVQEKIGKKKESFQYFFSNENSNNHYGNHFKIPTADLPSVYNWDEYFIKKIWENFRWKYKDDDGKYKDLPGRKSNGEWPCINEYILDHWLTGGKIEDKCC